jgi:MoaA/NifB/PqqE/SkfB family radical SAM enzyme
MLPLFHINIAMNNAFDISITSYCQATCAGCQRNDRLGIKNSNLVEEHVSYEDFCYIMDKLDQLGNCNEIKFCGEFGDPMMHPDIERFIDRVMLTTDKLWINTNGGLRQPKWYSHIAEKYSDKHVKIEWGIDGVDHDTNWLYRTGVNWQRAMDNMKSWTSAGGQGRWVFLTFGWNYHQIPQAVAMARDIGIKLSFSITIDPDGYTGIKPGPDLDRAKKVLAEYGYEL